MKTYTVEYRLVYTMTKEVRAESEDDAINEVLADPSDGEEHDVHAEGFDVTEEEDEDGDA